LLARTGAARHPLRAEVASDEESQGSAHGGASQAPQRAPDRPEQRAAGQRDDRAGQEQHGGHGVESHEQQRPRRPGGFDPGLQGGCVEALARGQRDADCSHQR
jgi:hypothetical protein